MAAHQTSVYNRGIEGRQNVVTILDYTAAGMDAIRSMNRAGFAVKMTLASDDELAAIVRMPASPRNMQKPDRAMLEALKSAALDELVNRGFDPDAVRWG